VSSVTLDLAASVSLQTAPPKSTRPDPSQGSDSFGSLVDSNAPVDTGNDRAASAARQQSASQRRADDDAAANADNTRSRNTASADRAARNASDDRDASAQQASDADASANSDANSAAMQRSRTKSGAPKPDAAKSDAKSSSDTASKASTSDSSTAAADPAPQGGTTVATPVATPEPVAVALAAIIPVTDTPAATPASGNATSPLAIAAAAIAASSAAVAPVVSAAPIKADSDASAAATASATAAVASSDTAATAKIATGVVANAAIGKPVNQQVPSTGISEVALAVAPAAAIAPKTTPLKAADATQGKTAASGDANSGPGTSDPSAITAATDGHTNTAQQPAVAARPEAANTLVDAAKENASAGSSAAATAATHEHPAIAVTAHAPTDALDTGVQPTGTFQSLLPAATAAAGPAGPLSVTAASNAPVPLSGLAVEIAASVRSGKTHFEIRLDPADLGRIDVRIDVDRNGQVSSHLTVEKPETLSMLRQDAPQLQQALDDAGFKTGSGGLQFSLRDQSSSGQNNGNDNGRNAQRLIVSDDDTMPAAVVGRSYGRMLGSSSGVDIRV
jgi:flagellar hook-length control protein FliK